MQKIGLWRAIGTVAHIGVVAGIVFLALEVDQSNRLARAQTRNDVAASVSSLLQNYVSDPSLIELWTRAHEAYDTLDAIERQRIYFLLALQMRVWENIYYQYRAGVFDSDEFAVEREVWRQDVNEGLFQAFYCSTQGQFAEGFMLEIEALMSSTDC